ncbi:MAG: SMC family ATPase [Lachnospiraceae bacterium]|nr:SMC family ATPase [Lachnospiraceae bacterium]
MRPIALTMRSFGSYGNETTIRFDSLNQNLFLITGDTGAGKTTIFDAIVFALYGETGSSLNKKDGVVLQSQFTAYDREPFVELIFSEQSGSVLNQQMTYGTDGTAMYTVRRVPRHLRLLTRGAGKGSATREVTGSVSLTMPDGADYPSKEIDKKLEEIVGLTKGQFMQVAMIAQGEFMELLRAKSDDKKVIFRKLFHTDLYQKIEEELANRRREKEKEMDEIRTTCRAEASHVSVPDGYEKAAEVNRLKKQMTGGEMTALDGFLEALDELCAYLKAEQGKADDRRKQARAQEIAKRNAYTSARNLAQIYEQLEAAQKEFAGYEAQKADIDELRKQMELLRAVSEIRNEYRLYIDAKKAADASERALSELEAALPGQRECLLEAEKNQEAQQKRSEEQQMEFARIRERVKQALDLFRKEEDAKKEIKENEDALKAAQKEADAERKHLERLEAQETNWRRGEQALSGVPERMAVWNGKKEALVRLAGHLEEVRTLQKSEKAQERTCVRARQEYTEADAAYQKARVKYETLRKLYLDEQAGILARDLKEGMPCPVCGSVEHPHPAAAPGAEMREISQELLNGLEAEAQKLATEQQKKAAASQTAAGSLAEKQESARRELEKLCREMEAAGADFRKETLESADTADKQSMAMSGDTDFFGVRNLNRLPMDRNHEQKEGKCSGTAGEEAMMKGAADWLQVWQKQQEEEKTDLEQKLAQLDAIRKNLSGIDEKKQKQREKADAADAAETAALARLEGSRQKQKALAEQSGSFVSKEEAEGTLKAAEQTKKKQEAISRTAADAAKTAKEKVDHTTALLKKYRDELPGQQQLCLERKTNYETCMRQRDLTEEEWSAFAAQHAPEEEKELQSRIDRYTRSRIAAKSRIEAALETIGDRPRPNPEALSAELKIAEEQLASAEEAFSRVSGIRQLDEETRTALERKLGERRTAVEEHIRLDTLYRLVSGNVKDSRMDLETFVQRYYMERILHAANRRFLEMSGGQFELRMVGVEMAGKGKNRGLDLMVYSTVTGKEREIRTLSGGESFMAALSLALGMADQIQQSTAAIHLDMMFIDEGFGSLDDHSRNQAVRVLKEMAGSDRLIGIISHVTELKQEIDDQLLVTKDETGSHVKWQIS